MSKKMQNLVFFMESDEKVYRTPLKGGNMILNRFCIDEDAAFELSGVYFFEKSSEYIEGMYGLEYDLKRKEKGKAYSL